jgi:hypothetical protein
VLNRISQPLDGMEHVDLLHAARRIYKKRLRQCSLASLEREVLGRERERDIPGPLVPAMFFEYLRSGDFEPMRLVLEHNRRDVASLLSLLCRLCHAVKRPEELVHGDDIYSCGRLHERAGRLECAEKCYRAAGGGSGAGYRELSMLLKRQGMQSEAVELWLNMLAEGGYGVFPYAELAKHFEHREADYQKALEIVEECMVKLHASGCAPGSAEYDAFTRRRDRLLYRLNETR